MLVESLAKNHGLFKVDVLVPVLESPRRPWIVGAPTLSPTMMVNGLTQIVGRGPDSRGPSEAVRGMMRYTYDRMSGPNAARLARAVKKLTAPWLTFVDITRHGHTQRVYVLQLTATRAEPSPKRS
jgi:hypothetical protein